MTSYSCGTLMRRSPPFRPYPSRSYCPAFRQTVQNMITAGLSLLNNSRRRVPELSQSSERAILGKTAPWHGGRVLVVWVALEWVCHSSRGRSVAPFVRENYSTTLLLVF